MSDEQFSLRELAALAEVTPRTVRYYTAEGLLPPPDTRGRYARYSGEHLRRLQQIAQLKADYLPLQVIRERLGPVGGAATGLAVEEDATLPEPAPPQQGWQRRSWPPRLAEGSAGYSVGEGLAGPRMQAGATGGADPFRLAPQPQVGRIEFFPDEPGAPDADEAERRFDRPMPATTEVWRCMIVAPGIELRLREPVSERRRRKVEAMLAALRDELLREEGE